jgi:hypothetical protein
MQTDQILTIAGIGLIFILMNAVFLGILFFTQRKVSAINNWPSIPGTVVSSQVVSRSDGEGGTTDYPAVTYSYSVVGSNYKGSKIAPGMEVGGMGAAKTVARYPVDSKVTVYYNPENPADAVLEKKAPAIMWIYIVLGIVDCALCGAIPLVYWALSQ